jgi:ABC-type polysaccharide/polyol phosphate transport system ATPase subunit
MEAVAAVRVEHVDASFGVFSSRWHRLRAAFVPWHPGPARVIPVLRDLTFSLPRGETAALLGANGAGKSTLLHLLAGVIEPTRGVLHTEGRIAALLDLGGTFLPNLTGRENTRLFQRLIVRGEAGAADASIDAIAEFAAIGDAFDRPVHTYSSGMFLRLAFACAVAEEPDILLIDEVLAVGDARFQQKCFARIRELRARGTTILMATHAVHGLGGLCDRVLVLEGGRLAYDGDAGRGISRYYQSFFASPDTATGPRTDGERRHGAGGAAIAEAFASRDGVARTSAFDAGDIVRVIADVAFTRDIAEPQLGFGCGTIEGVRLYATTSSMLGDALREARAGERRRFEITFRLDVAVGDVFIDLSIFEIAQGVVQVLDARVGVLHLTVTPPSHYLGLSNLSAVIRTVA